MERDPPGQLAGRPSGRELAGRGATGIAWLWAGLSLGVAFVAAPAKFLAPGLSLTVALEVGRQTFRLANHLELTLAGLALLLALASPAPRRRLLGLTPPVAIVLAQALWLIPALDVRTSLVQGGLAQTGAALATPVPPSAGLHALYVAAEALKILALVVAALVTAPIVRLRARPAAPAARPGSPRRRCHPCRGGHPWIAMPPHASTVACGGAGVATGRDVLRDHRPPTHAGLPTA